jgi:threonine dehydratase
MSEQLQGKTVVFPVSGRNIDLDTLESIVRTA